MIPSVKRIKAVLGNTLHKEYGNGNSFELACHSIRQQMKASLNFNAIDMALEQINKILCGYGVESMRDIEWDSYYGDIGLLYVNMGDTYVGTVIYDTRKKRWFVACLGDYVEKKEKRFSM